MLELLLQRIDLNNNHNMLDQECLNYKLFRIRIGTNCLLNLLRKLPDNDQNKLCELTFLDKNPDKTHASLNGYFEMVIIMSDNSLQETAFQTLSSDSSSGIVKNYVTNSSEARLSTVANILTQRFGNNWKMILILILGLFTIALIIVILF
jgi:hypothetical protein